MLSQLSQLAYKPCTQFCGSGGQNGFDPGDYGQPLTIAYNFTIDQRLKWNTILDVAYVGSKTSQLLDVSEGIEGSNFTAVADQNKTPIGAFFKPDPKTGVLSTNPENFRDQSESWSYREWNSDRKRGGRLSSLWFCLWHLECRDESRALLTPTTTDCKWRGSKRPAISATTSTPPGPRRWARACRKIRSTSEITTAPLRRTGHSSSTLRYYYQTGNVHMFNGFVNGLLERVDNLRNLHLAGRRIHSCCAGQRCPELQSGIDVHQLAGNSGATERKRPRWRYRNGYLLRY